MAKYRVYGAVVGSKYLGEFDAASKKEAKRLALESDAACVRLCHQCSGECEDPEVDINKVTVEEVEAKRAP